MEVTENQGNSSKTSKSSSTSLPRGLYVSGLSRDSSSLSSSFTSALHTKEFTEKSPFIAGHHPNKQHPPTFGSVVKLPLSVSTSVSLPATDFSELCLDQKSDFADYDDKFPEYDFESVLLQNGNGSLPCWDLQNNCSRGHTDGDFELSHNRGTRMTTVEAVRFPSSTSAAPGFRFDDMADLCGPGCVGSGNGHSRVPPVLPSLNSHTQAPDYLSLSEVFSVGGLDGYYLGGSADSIYSMGSFRGRSPLPHCVDPALSSMPSVIPELSMDGLWSESGSMHSQDIMDGDDKDTFEILQLLEEINVPV